MPNPKPKVFTKKAKSQTASRGASVNLSATNDALRRFQNVTKKRTSSTAQTTNNVSANNEKPATLCIRCPVVLKWDFLVKAYNKKPSFVVDAVLDLMQKEPSFAAKIVKTHTTRERLLKKYSFGKDILKEEAESNDMAETENEMDLDFMEKDEKSEKCHKAETHKSDNANEKSGTDMNAGEDERKVAKNSLKLLRSYVLNFDSKSKCKPGHEHKKLKSGDTLFWVILMAKFFNFAQHALPLMQDEDTKFSRQTRDEVCEAAIGCKYATLTNYRDVIWFRACSKKLFDEKTKLWKGREVQTSRKGDLYDQVKESIKEFKESKAYKNRKGNTKLQDLFLQVFPGFTQSPIYKN